MDDVQVVRLITGEQLIGKLSWLYNSEGVNSTVVLTDPVAIRSRPIKLPDGKQTEEVGLFKLLRMSVNNSIEIDYTKVLYIEGAPCTEVLNEYNALFGSGIVVPKTQILQG